MGARHLATGAAAPELVGRHEELAALHQALDALSAAASRVVQVAGEPGIGKTGFSLSSALEQTGGVAWCWGVEPLSSSGTCPSACSYMPSMIILFH